MSMRQDLETTVKKVQGLCRRAHADVRDRTMLQDVVNVSVEQLGVWMGAVANARVLTSGTWDVVCDGDWRIMLDINLIGTWNTCVAAIPHGGTRRHPGQHQFGIRY